MQIKGVETGTFIRTMMALSNAYMERVQDWTQRYRPKFHDGVTKEALKELRSPFDFIIVGSGYAGSLLANRIAGSGCHRVLLLEAGPAPVFETSVPFLQPYSYADYSWKYRTVEQTHAAKGMLEKRAKLITGRGLGGSSLIDHGIYQPENPRDFERWSEQFQLKNWSRAAMDPFLLVQELRQGVDFEIEDGDSIGESTTDANSSSTILAEDIFLMGDPAYTRIRRQNPLSFLWMQAGSDMGYLLHRGVSHRMYDTGGFFLPNGLSQNGYRQTPATQFLNEKLPNLVVITNARVAKLNYDNARQAVVGVEFLTKKGKKYRARAGREVILSAGALGTSRILLGSGIGPREYLKRLGVAPIQDLPVGERIRDRVSVNMFVKVQPLYIQSLKKKLLDMDEFKHYLNTGSGILSVPNIFGAAVLRTEAHYNPDLLVDIKPVGLMGFDELKETMNYDDTTMNVLEGDSNMLQDGGLQVTLTVLSPFSTGTLWLDDDEDDNNPPREKSKVKNIKPENLILKANPAYLQDERDLVTLIKGALFVEAVLETPYMQILDAALIKPNFDNCTTYSKSSSRFDYWRCIIPYLATTGRHITSTALMGSVVDEDLNVKGVKRLRVVDESVFPEPVTGGLAATVMAVANRASSMILEDHSESCFREK